MCTMEGTLREGERGAGVCMHDRKLALASYKYKRIVKVQKTNKVHNSLLKSGYEYLKKIS